MQEHNQFQRDSDGYLINPTGWNDAFAELIASETGLELTEPHWQILNVMRQFRATEGIAPDVRHVVEHLVAQGGIEKKSSQGVSVKTFPVRLHAAGLQDCRVSAAAAACLEHGLILGRHIACVVAQPPSRRQRPNGVSPRALNTATIYR